MDPITIGMEIAEAGEAVGEVAEALSAGRSIAQKLAAYTSPATTSGKSHPHPVVTTDGRKTRLGLAPAVPEVASNSGLYREDAYFESHLLQNFGEAKHTSLRLVLGKQQRPDAISAWLHSMVRHGVLRTQFAGRCLSAKDVRHFHMQCFRHNMSANASNLATIYPSTIEDYILFPGSTLPFTPGGTTGTGVLAAGETSFRDMLQQSVYFCPDNRADLEDNCWNLNVYKPTPTDYGAPAAAVRHAPLVPVASPSVHARVSAIYTNNDASYNPGATPPTWRYKAVINTGHVKYDFINKGEGGAKVIVVVYRPKKTHALPTNFTNYTTDHTIPLTTQSDAIGQGWMDKTHCQTSTDTYDGYQTNAQDIISNPAFPFMPVLKRTKAEIAPLVEIKRQTFALPSGGRRSMDIILGGDVYDPIDLPQKSGVMPILDNHSYCIVISTCGVQSSNVLKESTSTASYIVGDAYGPANVQFVGTYSEHLGSAMMTPDTKPVLWNKGGLIPPQAPAAGTMTRSTAVMLPTNRTVRMPATTGLTGTDATSTNPAARASNDIAPGV